MLQVANSALQIWGKLHILKPDYGPNLWVLYRSSAPGERLDGHHLFAAFLLWLNGLSKWTRNLFQQRTESQPHRHLKHPETRWNFSRIFLTYALLALLNRGSPSLFSKEMRLEPTHHFVFQLANPVPQGMSRGTSILHSAEKVEMRDPVHGKIGFPKTLKPNQTQRPAL